MDPFSKWVEICAMLSLHSWRVAEFLYDDLVACWGKLRYIQTDNSTEFAVSFVQLCKGLGIVYYHITIGNSKAIRQVEQTIRMIKDCIQHGLTKAPATFWMNYLASALLLLCMMVSRMTGITPYLLATGQQPLLPSMAISELSSLPDQLTSDEEEAYLAEVSHIIERLQGLGGDHIKEAEQRI